jgi:hypothetical protein
MALNILLPFGYNTPFGMPVTVAISALCDANTAQISRISHERHVRIFIKWNLKLRMGVN